MQILPKVLIFDSNQLLRFFILARYKALEGENDKKNNNDTGFL